MPQLTIKVTDGAIKSLEEIQDLIGAEDFVTVFRESMAVYETCLRLQLSGGKVLLQSADGKLSVLPLLKLSK
jgi:hypothetical protein